MIAISERARITKSNVSERVEQLAKQYNIRDEKTNIDFVANKFAELSGNPVNDDKILRLCLSLAKMNHISKPESIKFIHWYLSGKK